MFSAGCVCINYKMDDIENGHISVPNGNCYLEYY